MTITKLESSKLSGSLEDRRGKSAKKPEEYKPGVCFELQNIENATIKDTDRKSCPVIVIKESSEREVTYQMAMVRSGDIFTRISQTEKKRGSWGAWRKIVTNDDPTLDMIYKVDPSPQNKPALGVKGDVRIEGLKNKKPEKPQQLENLRPLVSDEQGDIFSLPYERDNTEDHFIIPILRSGRRSLEKDETTTIYNLFDLSGKYRQGGKHLIEIKLLFNHSDYGQGAAIIYYINNKLHHVHELGDVDKSDRKSDESLSFKKHRLTLEIVKSKKDKDERDIAMKYDGERILNIRYFITRYSTN